MQQTACYVTLGHLMLPPKPVSNCQVFALSITMNFEGISLNTSRTLSLFEFLRTVVELLSMTSQSRPPLFRDRIQATYHNFTFASRIP